MKRIRQKARSVKLSNSLIRPNPFSLSRAKPYEGPGHYRFHYGDSIITVHGGRLFEEDRGTLLRLLEMTEANDHRPVEFDIVELAKGRGLKNPYQESCLQPIRDSFERLLDVHIRIKPTKKRGFTAGFKLVEGYLDSDDTGSASVTPYLEIIRDLALGMTFINIEQYFSIKGQIARSLFVYLSSQRAFYEGDPKGYSIRLARLVAYLNYERADRPWWRVWENLKKAIEELQDMGLVGRYERDTQRCKEDGGIIAFWKAEAQKKVTEKEGTKAVEQRDHDKRNFQRIRDAFPNATLTDSELASAVSQLEKFLDPYIIDAKEFMEAYAPFLRSKNLSYYSPTLFKPDNVFFREFLSANQLETRQEKELKEKERAEAERQREEEVRKYKAEEKAKWDAMTDEEREHAIFMECQELGIGMDDLCD